MAYSQALIDAVKQVAAQRWIKPAALMAVVECGPQAVWDSALRRGSCSSAISSTSNSPVRSGTKRGNARASPSQSGRKRRSGERPSLEKAGGDDEEDDFAFHGYTLVHRINSK